MWTIKSLLIELMCKVHIVEDKFPIDTEGLIGWDVISSYKGIVDAAPESLGISECISPLYT